jgi:CelD/BcsL family acetyltransferase involved in cellulose biosynthesis
VPSSTIAATDDPLTPLGSNSSPASVQVFDPCVDPRWARFVDSAPDSSIFHHPRWLALLSQQYGYTMLACSISDRHGRLRAGLPLALISSRLTGRRLVALPFSDVCPPLSDGGGEHGLAQALGELCASMKVGLRVHGPLMGMARAGAAYHHHLLKLEPAVEAVQNRFTRRQALQGVRRAQREGVIVQRRRDADALAAFYRLHLATRKRQGIPTQPRRFILGFSALFGQRLGFVSIASVGGRPIAAAVFLVFNGVLTYKYGASDVRFLDRRPNNLLFMDAIRWGCERGLHTFDLGRTDPGHDSLRAFKRMWGAEEHDLQYMELGEQAGTPRRRDSPAAMRSLIQRCPPIVGRAVGELLYRHVG